MCVIKFLGRVGGVLGRRFAGAERGSRVSQIEPYCCCEGVRAAAHTPNGPFSLLERRHCIVEGRILPPGPRGPPGHL